MMQVIKYSLYFFVPMVLLSCNSNTKKSEKGIPITTTTITDSAKKDSLVHVTAFYIDESEVNSDEYEEYFKCPFDNYLKDPKTPKLAKAIYLNKEWDISNDTEMLALLDSLTAKNIDSRPFYFKVVTKTYKKSDGYYGEGLGLSGKNYLENNTKEFLENFDNKECFTERDLEIWTDIVMNEFSLIGEDEKDHTIINAYIKKLKANCKDCSENQKETLRKFNLKLKEKWTDFLKLSN